MPTPNHVSHTPHISYCVFAVWPSGRRGQKVSQRRMRMGGGQESRHRAFTYSHPQALLLSQSTPHSIPNARGSPGGRSRRPPAAAAPGAPAPPPPAAPPPAGGTKGGRVRRPSRRGFRGTYLGRGSRGTGSTLESANVGKWRDHKKSHKDKKDIQKNIG